MKRSVQQIKIIEYNIQGENMINDKLKPMVGAGLLLISSVAAADAPRDFCERALNSATERYTQQMDAFNEMSDSKLQTLADGYRGALEDWREYNHFNHLGAETSLGAPAPRYPSIPVMLIPKDCVGQYATVKKKENM